MGKSDISKIITGSQNALGHLNDEKTRRAKVKKIFEQPDMDSKETIKDIFNMEEPDQQASIRSIFKRDQSDIEREFHRRIGAIDATTQAITWTPKKIDPTDRGIEFMRKQLVYEVLYNMSAEERGMLRDYYEMTKCYIDPLAPQRMIGERPYTADDAVDDLCADGKLPEGLVAHFKHPLRGGGKLEASNIIIVPTFVSKELDRRTQVTVENHYGHSLDALEEVAQLCKQGRYATPEGFSQEVLLRIPKNTVSVLQNDIDLAAEVTDGMLAAPPEEDVRAERAASAYDDMRAGEADVSREMLEKAPTLVVDNGDTAPMQQPKSAKPENRSQRIAAQKKLLKTMRRNFGQQLEERAGKSFYGRSTVVWIPRFIDRDDALFQARLKKVTIEAMRHATADEIDLLKKFGVNQAEIIALQDKGIMPDGLVGHFKHPLRGGGDMAWQNFCIMPAILRPTFKTTRIAPGFRAAYQKSAERVLQEALETKNSLGLSKITPTYIKEVTLGWPKGVVALAETDYSTIRAANEEIERAEAALKELQNSPRQRGETAVRPVHKRGSAPHQLRRFIPQS